MSRYTQEFRDEAVRLVIDDGISQAQVARNLGINGWTLRDWVRAKRKSRPNAGVVRYETLEEENRRLRRELSIAQQELEILKKAAAYFAKEQL